MISMIPLYKFFLYRQQRIPKRFGAYKECNVYNAVEPPH